MNILRLAPIIAASLGSIELAAQQLTIYILAGQSNMEGHAKVSTFDYIGDDPKTAPWLEAMRGPDGEARVCDGVWISYLTGGAANGEGTGKLTAGFGSRRDPTQDGGKIGPEFTFGLTMDEAHVGPVLIIKTAWGGKSLHTDFRSPSAGPYEFPAKTLERFRREDRDLKQITADKAAQTGRYYRYMIEHVKSVLSDLERVCPDYDADAGFELAGMAWFQGWNDMVDSGTYPDRGQPGGYDRYSECMAHFIRDVRQDLNAPDLPFVIGVMGVNGQLDPKDRHAKTHGNFRTAMAAPAALAEFEGTVTAVQTALYWDAKLAAIASDMDKVRHQGRMLRNKHKDHANADGKMTDADQRAYLDKYRSEVVGDANVALFERGASNAAYHYLGCAKTMAGIGFGFAEALLAMNR